MRHQYGYKKLNRHGQHRRALLRNLATSLLRHERIETTLVKAKVLRGFAERLITLGKRGDLHARRQAAEEVHDHAVLQKLFAEVAPRFATRAGGYTRVLKTGFRRGDNADMALIELVDYKPQAPGAETVAQPTREPPADKAEKNEAKAKKKAEAKEARAKDKAEKAEAKKAKAEKKAAKPKAEKKPAKKAAAKKKASKK